MAAIAVHPLQAPGADPWPAVADAAHRWWQAQGVAPRDAVVLLPFAALLPLARAAFGRHGGWQPRIETPLTLAAALAPPPPAEPGAPTGDAVFDRLQAAALLRQQPWGAARERTDRRGFAHIVGAFVDSAHAFRDAVLALPPPERPAFWGVARERLPAATGPGGFEALLLRAALEWAATAGAAASDALFAHRPAAWVVLRLGGADALSEALPAATGRPGLVLDLDAAPADGPAPRRWVCDDAEAEAQAAAAQVIEALNAGRVPVGLVALDRVLVRRVRALLARHEVPVLDETGWTLSTTRAAARVMSLLRAAAPGAGADARLEWLKTWPPAFAAPRALRLLEAHWRDPGRALADDARALWERAQAQLAPLAAARERDLAAWLAQLRERLAEDGSLDHLRADPAGHQVLQSLRLLTPGAAWQAAAEALPLDLAGFTAWVDATLEAAQFVPPPPERLAEVVLTPLARAIGRPFACVVVPGADERHLGALAPPPGLAGDALAAALGLDHAAARRDRQRHAFAALLRAPGVVLLRRRLEGDEPLAPSPEVEAAALAAARAGTPWPAEAAWQPARAVLAAQPVARPAPVAPQHLPARLSASAVEALRQCPYRFFARSVLGLFEPDELDTALAKRDYGNWLHAVLYRFHRDRRPGTDDASALAAAADAETAAQGLDAAELLPFRASFDQFAPAYLQWLAGRDAEGWQWHEGEVTRRATPEATAPTVLEGRLDRIDRAPDGTLQVLDYKTQSSTDLKKKVGQPLEDTQLAFYAAVEPAATLAVYLALDDADAPVTVTHPDVPATAAVLVRELGAELARLRAGEPMPALGEPPACEHCEARGLCRRDHWGTP